jgi:rhamnosyltransferase
MHDVWIYNVAYAIGAPVVYDSNSYMMYRQHSSNVTGGQLSFRTKLYKLFYVTVNFRKKMSREILDKFRDLMPDENIELAELLANYTNSLKDKFKLLLEE